MTTPRLFCLFALLIVPATAVAQDAKMLVGAWKVTKSEESPQGTKLAFAADGKVTLTYVIDGKPKELAGTYTLSGAQLTMKLSLDGRERVDVRTVKKLTDSMLVTEDKNKRVEELTK